MKSFINPPVLVEVVMKSVLCMFGIKETWEEGKKFLGDMKFKDQLIAYSETIDSRPEKIFTKFRQVYLKHPKFIIL